MGFAAIVFLFFRSGHGVVVIPNRLVDGSEGKGKQFSQVTDNVVGNRIIFPGLELFWRIPLTGVDGRHTQALRAPDLCQPVVTHAA